MCRNQYENVLALMAGTTLQKWQTIEKVGVLYHFRKVEKCCFVVEFVVLFTLK